MSPDISETTAAERKRGVERIIAFSDAVVAIAATLLVLPLVDAAIEIKRVDIGELLSENGDRLFVFVLSFAVICRFWLIHHRMYEHVVDYTPALIQINFVWLLSIVFLPFPTQLLGSTPHRQPLIYGLYIGTMFVTTATAAAAQWIIARSPRVEPPSAQASASVDPGFVTAGAMAVALLVAVTVPQIGLWSLFLLFAGGLLDRFIGARGRGARPVGD
jgi:uncharacterized membrane protein